MSTTEAIPGSNARYTERLALALAPAWSTGRRIAWRGSETYRFVTPLRQRLDLLQANYGILCGWLPPERQHARRDIRRDLSDESRR